MTTLYGVFFDGKHCLLRICPVLVGFGFKSFNASFKEKLVRFQFLIICSLEHDVAVLAS